MARKGGPGVARADLLIINKVDLGEHVEVDVNQMAADAEKARNGAPVLPLSRKRPETIEKLCDWVRGMQKSYTTGGHVPIDPGPMAPHHHAHDYGHEHTHSHD